MFPQISLEEARSRNWDMVIAGSSFASMFFLYGLPRDMSVLIVERGPIVSHWDQLDGIGGLPNGLTERNYSSREKAWVSSIIFGGNSNCWWGQTPRFHPDDFRTQSRFGFALDWPIGYSDLEPYYGAVEDLMEIAGGGDEHILPRSRPYPFPPHAPSRSDAALRQNDPMWVASSCARANGGSRATCCANGICDRCPIDSKFTILNGIDKLLHPGASILTGTEFRALRHEDGVATDAIIRKDGVDAEIRGNRFALGAGAVFNAVILLRSGFQAPALGRYIHEQVGIVVEVDTPMTNFYGGTSITGIGYHFYHDFDRRDKAAVMIQNFNVPASIRPLKGRWTERLSLKLVAEDIPQDRNRIYLKNGEPVVEWYGHSPYSYAGIDYAQANLARVMPTPIEKLRVVSEPVTEAHIQGTTRMGESVETGVVDDRLRCHEVRNVFSLGAGAFPSCSPANPTLTLSALSLRAAEVASE